MNEVADPRENRRVHCKPLVNRRLLTRVHRVSSHSGFLEASQQFRLQEFSQIGNITFERCSNISTDMIIDDV